MGRTPARGVPTLAYYAYHRIFHDWCGNVDEGLIECGKAHEWFTDYSTSELVMVYKGG